MPETKDISTTKRRRPVIIAGVVVIVVVLAAVLASTGYLFIFKDRVMPGVSVNGVSLGGLTKEAADAKLNAAITIYEDSGLNFTDGKKTQNIESVQIPDGNADAAREILSFDANTTLSAAYAVGRNGNIAECLKTALATAIKGEHLSLNYKLDAEGFTEALRNDWKSGERPVNDARLSLVMLGNDLASVAVIPDSDGFEFDYSRAISDIRTRIASFDSTPVKLEAARMHPAVKTAEAEAAKALLPQALALAPLKMSADEFKWTLSANELAPMLEAYVKNDGMPSLRINNNAAEKYFKQLASEYDINAANTRYEIDPTTQKMTIFEAGKNGRKIDIEKSIKSLQAALTRQLLGADGAADFNIEATTAKSQIITATGADLGIKEVIGVGQSDFSGSSATRIKNVRHGSDKLNGVLIAPDAEFSALGVLEPVTIEDGYFPEQIILGDKIQPGVGGGLCQIGTTLFRMAMNTGLPITERQNHSLVVHYYSDPTNGNPGTDATLFGPHPDLRFVNNTGHWMLLTTDINVKTKKLTYTLWGTSDGRHGSYTPPKVTSWFSATDEVQNIEDPTLEPGKQKCQNAFRGAKTYFIYTIVNPDGTITERTFSSYYRALPKICTNGPALPGTVLPDGTVVPPAGTNTNTNTSVNTNLNLPPEATQGN